MFDPPNRRKKRNTSLQTWFTIGLICVVAVVFLAVFILIADEGGSTVGSFIDLDDTPGTYAGSANQIVAVNGSSTGLVFVVNTGSAGGDITAVGDVAQGEAFTGAGGGHKLFFHNDSWDSYPRIELKAAGTFVSSGTVTLPISSGTLALISDIPAEADTLQTVTDRGNTTTNSITMNGFVTNANGNMNGNDLLNVDTIDGNGTYVRVGVGTTSHGLSAQDDLLGSGKFEVNGIAYFDAALNAYAGINMQNSSITNADDITANNTVSATAFDGDGAALTGLELWRLEDTATGTNNASASNNDVLTWDGSDWIPGTPAAGSQDLWATMAADAGSTTANSPTDTFTIAGGANVTTSIAGDTVTINSTAVSGTPNLQEVTDVGSQTTQSITVGAWISNGTSSMTDHPIEDVGYVQFDIALTDGSAEGRLQWNADDGTLEFGLPGGVVNLQVGQEMLSRVRNNSGTTVANGAPVAITGAQGSQLTVAESDASNPALGLRTYAVATEDILNNQSGYVTTMGVVRDLDTSDWVVGTVLYLGTAPGSLTSTAPSPPNTRVAIGVVRRSHATEGEMESRPTIITPVRLASDVYAPIIQDNQGLYWNAGNSRFEVGTPAGVQNLFSKFISDSGSRTAQSPTEVFTFNGGTNIATSISGTTMQISFSGTVAGSQNLQQVTDEGNTTTNPIEFNGGTSNANVNFVCDAKTYLGSNSPLTFSGTEAYIPTDVTGVWAIGTSGSMGAKTPTLFFDNGAQYTTVNNIDETYPAQSLHAYMYAIGAGGPYVTVIAEDSDSARMLAYMNSIAGAPGLIANYASPVYTWSGTTQSYTWVGTPTVAANSGSTTFVDPPTLSMVTSNCIELQTDGDIVASGSISATGNVSVDGTLGSTANPALVDLTAATMSVNGSVETTGGGNITSSGYITASNYIATSSYVAATGNVVTTSGIFQQNGTGTNLFAGDLDVAEHVAIGNAASVAAPQVVNINETYAWTVGSLNAASQTHVMRISGRIQPTDSGSLTSQTWGLMADVTLDATQGSGTITFGDQVVGLEGSAYAEVDANTFNMGSVIGIQAYSRGSVTPGHTGILNGSVNAYFVFEPNLTTYGNATGLSMIANMTDTGGVIGNWTYLPMITNMSGDSFVSGDLEYIDIDSTNFTDNVVVNNWRAISIREPSLTGSAQVTGVVEGIYINAFTDIADGLEREIVMEGDAAMFFRSGEDKFINSGSPDEIMVVSPGTINLQAPEVYIQQDIVIPGTIYGTSPVGIGDDLMVDGDVYADYYYGSGQYLTDIPGSGTPSLSELLDVDTGTSNADADIGNVLIWNPTTSKWESGTQNGEYTLVLGEDETLDAFLGDTTKNGVLDAITITDEGGLNIQWSEGEVFVNETLVETDARGTDYALTDNATTYIYATVAGSGTLQFTTGALVGQYALIAIATTYGGDIEHIFTVSIIKDSLQVVQESLYSLHATMVVSGLVVAPDADGTNANDFTVTTGSYYLYGLDLHTISDTLYSSGSGHASNDVKAYFHVGGTWSTGATNGVDFANWDNGTGTTSTSAGKWYSGWVFIEGTGELEYVYPQTEHSGEQAAIDESVVYPPGHQGIVSPLAQFVFKSGVSAFGSTSYFIDIRPMHGGGGGQGGDQNIWYQISGDSGATSPTSLTSALTIAGGSGIDTSIAGNTVTISSTSSGTISGTAITIASETSLQIYQDAATYVCSGSQMETTINTALQEGAGGLVYQYPGDYWTIGSIVVPGSTVYEAASWDTRILRRGNADGVTIINAGSSTGCSGVTVRNFWIDGGRDDGVTGNTPGVVFRHLTNGLIENCWVQDTDSNGHPTHKEDRIRRGIGVGVDDCSNVTMRGNYLYDCYHAGVTIRNHCNQIEAYGNFIWDQTNEGIMIGNKTFGPGGAWDEQCWDINVRDNFVWDCGVDDAGIYIEDQATSGTLNAHTNVTIDSNYIDNCAVGIMTKMASDARVHGGHTITNNTIKNTTSTNGILVQDFSDVTIATNFVGTPNTSGISLNNSSDSKIVGNTVMNSVTDGLSLYDSPGTLLTINIVKYSGDDSISISGTSNNCSFIANRLIEPVGNAIQLGGATTGCIFSNNTVDNPNDPAVLIEGNATDNSIVSNYFYNLGDNTGIFVRGAASRTLIEDNYVHGLTTASGIYLDVDADDCVVTGNYVENIEDTAWPNGKGIYSDVNNTLISDNRIIGLTPTHSFIDAIHIDSNANDNTVENNYLCDSNRGDEVDDDGTDTIVRFNTCGPDNLELTGHLTLSDPTVTIDNEFISFPAASGTTVITTRLDTDDFSTTSAGTVTLAATEYEIILTPGGAIVPTSAGAGQSMTDGTNMSYYTLGFEPAIDEIAYWEFIIPDTYTSGSITPTILWTGTPTAGDVVWSVQTVGRTDSEQYDAALGAAQSVTTTIDGTTEDINTSVISEFDPGWAAGDIVIWKMLRDADNGSDTMVGDADAIMMKITWPSER